VQKLLSERNRFAAQDQLFTGMLNLFHEMMQKLLLVQLAFPGDVAIDAEADGLTQKWTSDFAHSLTCPYKAGNSFGRAPALVEIGSLQLDIFSSQYLPAVFYVIHSI
jgi:hypothetical protein